MRVYQLILTLLLTTFTGFSQFSVDSVIALSDSCVQIKWTPDSINTDASWYEQYGSTCTGADTIYKRCDFIPGIEYTGIPYSYGGEDAWYTFRDHLQKGFLVGSHSCHYSVYGDPTNRVTGTDCSGFLSFVWGYPRSTTSTFYSGSAFTTIPIIDVKPGDALIKATSGCGYHAILIVEALDITEVVISEASSTVFGCRERVVDLSTSAWQCYKAIRYPKLVNRARQVQSLTKTDMITIQKIDAGCMVFFQQPLSGSIEVFTVNGRTLYSKTLENCNNILIETGNAGVMVFRITDNISKKPVIMTTLR
ncbi:MAG: hypothetical protein ACM31E_00655 [Fibrobacterota bacterium]|nr:hypothetical protein [Chitinispirillaceae bacterium]